ncbi:hypothetical protein [Pleurocapsa sp. PCC 7319]|uniref:DUF7005 family protein n=1 Tax=Pleurocapsa sp. PCC 7319 TaxID=118161 RepID=UPI000347F1A1|nr:hypothetical protein [Pleurocapsa sp. PCC 7319]
MKLEERTKILRDFDADEQEVAELLAYNQNIFQQNDIKTLPQFPLASESHIAVWQEYVTQAKTQSSWETLKNVLVQLKFPIQSGISQTASYRGATLKGIEPNLTNGLILQKPEELQLTIHQSLAGKIPVLLTTNREDFVSLVRAITKRNEPVAIPDSMGACMVAGYNNWDRIRRYRRKWSANNIDNSESAWSRAFKQLIAHKELYQDKFIILSDGFYSNVAPEELGISKTEWKRLSLTIRLEHECTHYFTRRVFNSMQNNLLDEFIADYRGIVAATGSYKADWFLRFMGLESFPHYREGGRLQNYRGQLSEGAFTILQKLVKSAAENLEDFDRNYAHQLKTTENQTTMLVALTSVTIEELASSHNYLKKKMESQLSTCSN